MDYVVQTRYSWLDYTPCTTIWENLKTNWCQHVITFAIFSIPIVGAIIRLAQLFISIESLHHGDCANQRLSQEIRIRDLKDKCCEYKINSLIFCLSLVIYVVAIDIFFNRTIEILIRSLIECSLVLSIFEIIDLFLIIAIEEEQYQKILRDDPQPSPIG